MVTGNVAKIKATSLDSGVELNALAKLPEPEPKALIDRAAAGDWNFRFHLPVD